MSSRVVGLLLARASWLLALCGSPAEYQPGQAPCLGGGTDAVMACRADAPGLLEQAVALAGLLCVVLTGFAEVLVEGHGLLPGGGCDNRAERPGSPAPSRGPVQGRDDGFSAAGPWTSSAIRPAWSVTYCYCC
jgi:hypothetical protein